jgi:hypothetical protein
MRVCWPRFPNPASSVGHLQAFEWGNGELLRSGTPDRIRTCALLLRSERGERRLCVFSGFGDATVIDPRRGCLSGSLSGDERLSAAGTTEGFGAPCEVDSAILPVVLRKRAWSLAGQRAEPANRTVDLAAP